MEVFELTRLMGLSTDSIPSSAYEEKFGHERTHYYQSLLIGDEYKQDEGDRREIRHLMRLEKEMMDDKGEVTVGTDISKSQKHQKREARHRSESTKSEAKESKVEAGKVKPTVKWSKSYEKERAAGA
ncbi:hypothetical protein Tco_0815983 [Tanacetum coccineum]